MFGGIWILTHGHICEQPAGRLQPVGLAVDEVPFADANISPRPRDPGPVIPRPMRVISVCGFKLVQAVATGLVGGFRVDQARFRA